MISRRLDDRTVLVDLRTNRILELNPTGARLWELIDGRTEAQMAEQLLREFDVPGEEVTREVRSLIESLLDEGLIVEQQAG